jgi:L-ascorbate metabolism protein UlaG (beta-lactamase superfamily)
LAASLAVGCKSGGAVEDDAGAETGASTGAADTSAEAGANETTADSGEEGKTTPESAAGAPNEIAAADEPIKVTPFGHGSLMLSYKGKNIYIDPVANELPEGDLARADLVLVTHIHGDHLDPASIARVRKDGAPVVSPASVAEKAGAELPEPTIMANGDSEKFLDGAVEVEAVAMYNLVRKRDNGEFFHPKGRGNGYVLTLGGKRIYISGDTECTPEMKALENIDAAFVCMNLPYTMTVEEAGGCLAEFKPKVAYPYHHRDQDPGKLEGMLQGKDVEVTILEWYPEK